MKRLNIEELKKCNGGDILLEDWILSHMPRGGTGFDPDVVPDIFISPGGGQQPGPR